MRRDRGLDIALGSAMILRESVHRSRIPGADPMTPSPCPADARARRATFAGLVAALLLPLAFTAPAAAQRGTLGPDVIPDLVEQTIDTVVNISTTARVPTGRGVQPPQQPPGQGMPFQEFLEEFFNRRNEQNRRNPQQEGEGGGDQQRRVSSLGSGFVIDAAGIIVTNNHVIENADEITAIFHDGTRLRATVIGRDPQTDLAVLRVEVPAGRTLRAARWGDSERVRIGEWVIAIGNPLGFGGTVTAGIISARNRDINQGRYDNFLQTDAPINRGNSGGPLFNMRGEVIGINTAIVSPSGGSIGIGFAIPSNLAQTVIGQLAQFGETRRGWIGVRIQAVTDEIAENIQGLGRARGAMIAGVTAGGPAAAAGIQTGDVVLRFNNRDVSEMRELPRIVAETPVGQSVPVTVFREGQERTLNVTVGRLEENEPNRQAARQPPQQQTPPPQPQNAPVLGMTLAGISADLRRQYRIADDVRGVVITRVAPGSAAAERGIQAGHVIVEVAQEAVSTPAEVQRRIDALRGQNRRSALVLVANPQGEVRFVALNIAPN